MEYITRKINLPEIGSVEIKLTENQMNKAIAEGKNIFNESQNETVDPSNYIHGGGMATTDTPGGFTNNDVDWDSFFPDISLQDIKDLTNSAIEQEEKLRAAAIVACSLANIALASYMNKNSAVESQSVQNATKDTTGAPEQE